MYCVSSLEKIKHTEIIIMNVWGVLFEFYDFFGIVFFFIIILNFKSFIIIIIILASRKLGKEWKRQIIPKALKKLDYYR